MLFGYHTFDKTIDEHQREIAALASDPQTLVFIDTNILAYLYKLHEAARREFFVWSDAVVTENRLAIPAWAASEYLSRVTSKALDSYTPKSKEPSQAKKALDALHETASLFVDEPLLRRIAFSGDRAAYLNGFRQAINELEKYTRAFSQQFEPGIIHQQVVKHLSAAILDSDLAALCTRASQEGNARFEHRLPPGFRDRTKDENRLGDLIIWLEILDKSAASVDDFSKVLFITNDEKSDWVYAPKMRTETVAGTRRSVGNSNPEIKLADPRLVSEFQRSAGHKNLVISSLATLVEGLSKISATQFSDLAAAIQINTQEATPLPPTTETQAPVPTDATASVEPPVAAPQAPVELAPDRPSVQPTEPAVSHLQYDLEALQDSQYQADAPSDINTIISALKSLNWYTQNPAIVQIRTLYDENFPSSAWFVLGRNIYQAACGNSQKAMEFMAALESRLAKFSGDTAQHILAGMLFEIYFDGHGQFRDEAKFGYADKPLALVATEDYNDARTFILFHLNDHRSRLKFLPGDIEKKIIRIAFELRIQADEDESVTPRPVLELKSVTLDGIELIQCITDETADVGSLIHPSTLTPERLKATISEELAIPKWALTNQFDSPAPGDTKLTVPKGQKLNPKQALVTHPNA